MLHVDICNPFYLNNNKIVWDILYEVTNMRQIRRKPTFYGGGVYKKGN